MNRYFCSSPEGQAHEDKQRASERSELRESLSFPKRSEAPIVERKHGKTLGEFLSAVSLPVPTQTVPQGP
jgi:hypothetical protein